MSFQFAESTLWEILSSDERKILSGVDTGLVVDFKVVTVTPVSCGCRAMVIHLQVDAEDYIADLDAEHIGDGSHSKPF